VAAQKINHITLLRVLKSGVLSLYDSSYYVSFTTASPAEQVWSWEAELVHTSPRELLMKFQLPNSACILKA